MQLINRTDQTKSYIGLSEGKGWVSQKIMKVTSGNYSHTFAIINGIVYQTHFGEGAHCLPLEEYETGEALRQKKITLFEVSSLNEGLAKYFAAANLPYDKFDIAKHYKKHRFDFNWDAVFSHQNSQKLICTELVDWLSGRKISYALNLNYSGMITPQAMFEACQALMGVKLTNSFIVNRLDFF